jgi:DNA-binding PadR family transcriptional regulator
MTLPTAAVLLAVRAGHRYGFDIMDVTGLPDGTVYPILRRLEDRGALKGRWEADETARADRRPPRRYYELTPLGADAALEALRRFPALGRATDLAGDAAF